VTSVPTVDIVVIVPLMMRFSGAIRRGVVPEKPEFTSELG